MLQICEEVLDMLRNPDVFGVCDDVTVEAYMSQCHSLFPLHRAFVKASPVAAASPAADSASVASETTTTGGAVAVDADCNNHGDATAADTTPSLPNGNATP